MKAFVVVLIAALLAVAVASPAPFVGRIFNTAAGTANGAMGAASNMAGTAMGAAGNMAGTAMGLAGNAAGTAMSVGNTAMNTAGNLLGGFGR